MSPFALAPDDIVADRYRIERKLGEGGMGKVYLVQHTKTEERFALKILNPSVADTEKARERFRREARTPARIDSDHVCRVVDSDIAPELDDAPFLVLEYLRGEDLNEISRRAGPLPPSEVVLYLSQVARALDKAHSIGVVHRDLKPENLFLTMREDGTPCMKILEIGPTGVGKTEIARRLAKLTGASSDIPELKATATGDVFGTPLFMSPEQCKSESEKISPRTDVWALGLIAFRLLQGEDFWTATTLTHLIAQVAYEDMPTPSERGADLGEDFDVWFARCCNREIDDRYRTAGEAIDALAVALKVASVSGAIGGDLIGVAEARKALTSLAPPSDGPGEGEVSKTTPAITVERTDPAGRRWLPVAAAASLLFGASLGGIWFGREEPTPAPAVTAPDPPEPAASEDAPVEPVPAPPPPAVTSTASASMSAPPVVAPKPTPRPTWSPPPSSPPPPAPAVDPLDSRR